MADNLTTATIDVRANTRGMERDILKALQTVELSQINTKKSSQALGRITGQVSEFNKSLEASNARVIAFGASAGAIFAVEKALTSLISSTINVQKQLADVNVLLNLSSSSLEKFGSSLFDIARNTAQSFSEVATAATELSRQGLGVEETLKRTNAALILTRLSGLDAKSSVEALTATLNSFSGSALDAVEVVNKLANVDAAFAVSSADLANAISRVGSTAVDAGVSLDELIALVTSAQQTTARGGAVIGNSFKTIFTRLQRGKVQDLLGSLGVDTGEGQSAISLLQQLASTYDTLGASQKSYVAEQVGGVFQINILKAALSDLGKEYSIYGRALDTSLSSTDEAIRRNELLNKTVSALSSQTVASLEQAANKIGSIVFEPNAKGFLSGFNNLLESFNNIDAESAGGKLMTGFFKGIGDFIGGPGAVLATAVLVKLFARLGQFAAGSAKELLGTNKAAQQQAAIEQSILSILQKNSQFTSQILAGKMTTVQAEKQMLDYLTAQSNILREQERLSKVIGANLAMKGVSVGASGIPMTAPAKKTKAAASGYIPNFVTDMAVGQAMESAGAREHGYKAGKARKTTIHDGNGKSFKSFVNNKEDVKTFTNAAGKKATVVRPPNGFGENTQYAAGGYIPNFAKNKVESLSSVKSGGDLKKLYDFGIRGKKNSKTDYYSENVSVDRIKLPYSTSTYDARSEVLINRSLEQKKDLSSLKYKGVPIGNYLSGRFDQSKLATGNKIGNVSNVKGALGEIDTEVMLKKMGITPVKLSNKFGVDFSYKDKLSKQQLGESKVTKEPVKDDVIYAKALTYLGRKANPSYKGNSNSDTVDLSALGVGLNLFESKASGFVPNFASMGSKFKAMYGGGTTMRAVDKEKTAKKKNLDVKKLDLSDRYTMVHGGNQGLDSANVSLEAGNKLFDAKIATAGLNTTGTNLQRYGIKGVVGDALVGATNNIIKTFGGTEQITDASSLDNAGSVGSAAGTVFETALRKAFNAPAVSQTQRIDFPAPTPELKKFFHNAPGQYEAKISRTPDNLKSTLKKWVDVNGLASSASGFVPNFAKTSGLSFSQSKKDEFGFSSINAILGGKKVGGFSYSEDKPGNVDVGDLTVEKAYRGKGYGSALYEEAIKRNKGKKMKGQLLPQMNRLLQKIKNGEPVSAETLYPQIKRADLAKSSMFEVYGHKGMEIEKMTRDQFASFVNAKINELKKDPKKLQSYFGNVEADEYGGLGVDLQTQHASGFVPNFLDIKKDGSLPFGVRGRANFSKPGSKPNIQLGVGATPDTLFHEASHLAYSKATMSKANSNEGIGRFLSDPRKYAGVSSIMASSIFKNVNQNELFKSLGLNPVQLDFDGKNPGATYSGAKAVDEITTRIQEKIFKNKGNLASLSANENTFVKNLEGLGIISNKRMSNVSRRSAEGSKFRSLIEGRFSSAMGGSAGGSASGFIPNFADQVRKNMYDWDGTIIPKIRGGEDEYIRQLGSLKEKDLLPIGKKLKAGKKKFDVLTSRPPLFEKAIRETSSRLGLPVNKISFGVKPKDKLVEAQKRGSKIVDDNLDLMGKPGFLNARVLNKRLSSGFVPNFGGVLSDAIGREQAAGLSKSQIYVDKHSSLKNKNNPMGLMVANRRDEPGGGIQGINRAKKEGRNPKTYGGGMSSGFVPNYALFKPDQIDVDQLDEINKSLEEITNKIKKAAQDFSVSDEENKIKKLEGRKKRLEGAASNGLSSTEIVNQQKTVSKAQQDSNIARTEREAAAQLVEKEKKTGTASSVASAERNFKNKDISFQGKEAALDIEKKNLAKLEKDLASKVTQRIKSIDDQIKAGKESVSAHKNEVKSLTKQQASLQTQKKSKGGEMSAAGRAKKFVGDNAMSLGFGLQSVASIAGEFAGNDDTQSGRTTKAVSGMVGDIASFAGTGAMIAGPYGALAGGLVGAAKGAIGIEKALKSKLPEFEKALDLATQNYTKFSESGQTYLAASEKFRSAGANPDLKASELIDIEKEYISALQKLPEQYQSQLVAAEALGNAQQVYAEVLQQLAQESSKKQTGFEVRGVREKGELNMIEKMFSNILKTPDQVKSDVGTQLLDLGLGEQIASLGSEVAGFVDNFNHSRHISSGVRGASSTLSEKFNIEAPKNFFKEMDIQHSFGKKTSSQDLDKIVSETFKYAATEDNSSTANNEAVDAAKSFESAIKNISSESGFKNQKNALIEAIKAAYTSSGGGIDSGEMSILEELSSAINRPDQLNDWIQKYKKENEKIISGQEKFAQAKANVEKNRNAQIQKRKDDLATRSEKGARFSNLQNSLNKVFSGFSSSIENVIDSLRFNQDMSQASTEFRRGFAEQAGFSAQSKKIELNLGTTKIFDEFNIKRLESQQQGVESLNSTVEPLISALQYNNLEDLTGASLSGQEAQFGIGQVETQSKIFDIIKNFASTGFSEGGSGEAKGQLNTLIKESIKNQFITEESGAKIINAFSQESDKQLNSNLKREALLRQQLAQLAQQTVLQRASQKLLQAQKFGGGSIEDIFNPDQSDTAFGKAIEAVQGLKTRGYSAEKLKVDPKTGKLLDKQSGAEAGVNKENASGILQFYKAASQFSGGVDLADSGSADFENVRSAVQKTLQDQMSSLIKAAEGVIDPATLNRMSANSAGLGGMGTTSFLKTAQEMGVVKGGDAIEAVSKDYADSSFAGLPKQLKDAYTVAMTAEAKTAILNLAATENQTSVLAGGLDNVVSSVNLTTDAISLLPEAMAAGISSAINISRKEEAVKTNAERGKEIGSEVAAITEQMSEGGALKTSKAKAEAKIAESEKLLGSLGYSKESLDQVKFSKEQIDKANSDLNFGSPIEKVKARDILTANEALNSRSGAKSEVFYTNDQLSALGEKKSALSNQQKEIEDRGIKLTKEYDDAKNAPALSKEQSDKIEKINQARRELDSRVSGQAQKRSATVSGLNDKAGAKLPPNVKRAQDEAYAETMGRLSRTVMGANGAVVSGGNTLETEAMGSSGGDRSKAFNSMLNGNMEGKIGVPSLKNFRDIYENLSDQTTAEQEYAEKFRALTGRTVEQAFPKKKTGVTGSKPQQVEQDSINKGIAASQGDKNAPVLPTPPVGPAAVTTNSALSAQAGAGSGITVQENQGFLENFGYTQGEGFKSEQDKADYEQAIKTFKEKKKSKSPSGSPAAVPQPSIGQIDSQVNKKIPDSQKAQEQKKVETNTQEQIVGIISSILTSINELKSGIPGASGTDGGTANTNSSQSGAVSVSTSINLSINSTAGENKTEVASVADQIKNGISQFFSSPEFLERVTTIAKTAAGNPPPPKSKV